jgi:hypothetical protein
MKTALTALVVTLAAGAGAHADVIVGLTQDNSVIRFDSSTQTTLGRALSISGLQTDEQIVGIDFRPANGMLYGLGSSRRLYTIDLTTGQASAVGGQFGTALRGSKFGIDFNPVVDRLRVTSNEGINLSVNPNDGAATAQNDLTYAAGDVNASATPFIVGAAYANSFVGATTTRLYTIDSALDALAVQNSAFNLGRMSTVGSLLVDTGTLVGFDIAPSDGTAFAAFDIAGFPNTNLYRIDLATGGATFLGGLDYSGRLADIAVVVPAPGGFALLAAAGIFAARRRRS